MALVKDNEREELAAAYACFLLHDAGVEVSVCASFFLFFPSLPVFLSPRFLPTFLPFTSRPPPCPVSPLPCPSSHDPATLLLTRTLCTFPQADNIGKLMTGAGIKANPFYAALFGKVLAGKNIEDFISVSAAPAAAAAAPAGEAKGEEKKEEKKEEKEEEEEADLGLDLFG